MKNKGFFLIEVLVAVAIFAVMVVSVYPVIGFMIQRTNRSKFQQTAALLLQEGMEVSYNYFLFNPAIGPGNYKPVLVWVGPGSDDYRWELTSGNDTGLETRFNRQITVKLVCRNSEGNIVDDPTCSAPNQVDTKSKIIEGNIFWEDAGQNKTLTAKLTAVNFK